MTPGDCPDEGTVIDGKKSYCSPWERWTNCREMGHCTFDKCGGQAALLDLEDEEDSS